MYPQLGLASTRSTLLVLTLNMIGFGTPVFAVRFVSDIILIF
jgi:hypothetical protein